MTHALIPWLAAWSILGFPAAHSLARAAAPAEQESPSRLARQVLRTQEPRLQVPTAEMPNLVGMTLQAAQGHPVVLKLRLALAAESIESTLFRPGTIARQSVQAGQPVRGGSRVIVYVAVGGVEVPAVEGLTLDAARERLARLGFRADVTTTTSARVRPGLVSRQAPSAGTLRPRGSAVQLEVGADQVVPQDPRPGGRGLGDVGSTLPGSLRLVVVPDVVGLDDTVATERLEKSGLKVRMRREPARARPGSVFRQTPEPSTRVAPGSLVDITVAQQIFVEPPKPPDFGAQPDATVNWVVVPDLLGVDSQRAGSMLDRVGLRGRQRRVATARANPGVIIGQNPPAGTKVIRGSLVDLSVAVPGQPDAQPQPTAPQQPTQYKMPNLVGRPFGQALEDATVTQIGLRIIRQDDRFANARPGIVVRQSVAAADPVTPASVVTVWVATGAVVPDVAGLPSQLARQRVVDAGLQPRLNEVVRDGAPGIVVDQTPNPGVVVSRGAAVGLSISVLERVTVPDVRRRPRGDTANMLADLRLKGEFGTDPESDLAPDLVANQDPQPGVDVDVGTVVRMRVATGVVVPAVVKLSANVARARLEAATLGVEERTEVNDGVPESTVLRQSPESSARVARGAIVSVVVAVRRTVAVPDLLGRARADVERLLSPLALTPQFETATTAAPDARPGTVVQQVPVAGTIVGTGAMIRVVLVPAAGLPLPAGAQLPAAAQPRLTAGQPPPSEPAGSVPPPLGWWQHYPSSALPWLLGVGLFTLVAYRFIKANRGGVEIRTPDVPPLLDLQLEPHPGEAVARLAVSGPSLIKFDVRIRTATDPGEQTLLPAGPLLGEERRLYE